ncbi:hypothetical protein Tco_1487025 [Tanacetum coccineum]
MLNESLFWPDQSMYSTVLPPKHRKMPGKPRKKRIRAISEGSSSTRVSKVVTQTPKPKGVLDRPRKNQSVDDLDDVDVILRAQVRDEGASGSRGGVSGSREGASGSRGRGGARGSRGGASRSRGGATISREGVGGSRVVLVGLEV